MKPRNCNVAKSANACRTRTG